MTQESSSWYGVWCNPFSFGGVLFYANAALSDGLCRELEHVYSVQSDSKQSLLGLNPSKPSNTSALLRMDGRNC